MTTHTPENPDPNADPATPPTDEPVSPPTAPAAPVTPPPDDSGLSPEDVRTQPPEQNRGSGQFAVWDQDLGQYVSGVSDKATADKARKGLEDHNGAVTDGHTLETREV